MFMSYFFGCRNFHNQLNQFPQLDGCSLLQSGLCRNGELASEIYARILPLMFGVIGLGCSRGSIV